jgi:hypothetical protein
MVAIDPATPALPHAEPEAFAPARPLVFLDASATWAASGSPPTASLSIAGP